MQTPRLSAIAAIGTNTRAMGSGNNLLWHLPLDIRRFKELTTGHPVVMGRKTWESLPERFRPLPNRTNIVVSRDAHYNAAGAVVCTSIEEALEVAAHAPGGEEIFNIGGGILFAEALARTDRLYLTLVDDPIAGDTYFPEYSEFSSVLERETVPGSTPTMTFLTLERP